MTEGRSSTRARFYSRLILLCAVVLFAGCAAKRELRPQETRLQVIREVIKKNNDEVRSFSGRAQLVIESPQQSFSGDAVVRLLKPDSLYIRVEALLGLDVGMLQADRRRFVIFAPTERTAYTGSSVDTLRLQSLLGFDMTFDQLMQAVSGVAPIVKLQKVVVKSVDENLVITGIANLMHYEYTINTQFGAVARVVLRDEAGKIMRIEEYKQFMRRGNARIPRFIRFIRPSQKESLTLFYRQIDVNPALQPNDFSIKLPADVIKLRL